MSRIFMSRNRGKRLHEVSLSDETIERKIYPVRGHNVMLDRDLAALYGVATRVLNQAVRRNQERFPQDFLFVLSREEIMHLSQIVISSEIKHAPNVFAFTEQGVAMLSGVLRSRRAIQVNIAIMRAFVKLKGAIAAYKRLARRLNALEQEVGRHDKDIRAIFNAIRHLLEPLTKPKRRIGFLAD